MELHDNAQAGDASRFRATYCSVVKLGRDSSPWNSRDRKLSPIETLVTARLGCVEIQSRPLTSSIPGIGQMQPEWPITFRILADLFHQCHEVAMQSGLPC